jgi:hypothetical protein
MIGRIEETSASFEARSAPRSYPTTLGQSRRMDRPANLAACPLSSDSSRFPGFTVVPGLIERRLRLAQRIPAAGRAPQRMFDQTTPGAGGAYRVQAEREPSSLMARNIRFPASTLEDRGHA